MNKRSWMLMIVMLITVMTISTTVDANEAELLSRIEALESRVAVLEGLLKDTPKDVGDKSEEITSDETITVTSGVYIVGEDIDAGKYSVSIFDGLGELQVFSSYDNYVKTSGNQFSAIQSYDVAEPEKTDNPYWTYVSEVGNVILQDGMCLVMNKVGGIFTKK